MRISLAGGIIASCIALGGCERDAGIVGSYIADDINTKWMVQITSVEDRELRGRMLIVRTDDNGKISAGDRAIRGTVEGRSINLRLENGTGLSLITGTVTDKGLDLTLFSVAKSEKVELARTGVVTFDKLVDQVRQRSAEIRQEVAQAEALKAEQRSIAAEQRQISEFADLLSRKADRITDLIVKVNAVRVAYPTLTAQAAQLKKERQRLVTIVGENDYRVGQVSYDLERTRDEAASQRQSVQGLLAGLDEAIVQRESQASIYENACMRSADLDCGRLRSAFGLYHSRISGLRDAISKEAAAYKVERSKI